MKTKKLHSLEELGSCERKILGKPRRRIRIITGVPVRESVEYRILQLKKEIAAMDAELPKATKQVIAITIFDVTKYYRLEDLDAVIASKFVYTIVEVEENTQIIRFGF